jgi:hypothetical protein
MNPKKAPTVKSELVLMMTDPGTLKESSHAEVYGNFLSDVCSIYWNELCDAYSLHAPSLFWTNGGIKNNLCKLIQEYINADACEIDNAMQKEYESILGGKIPWYQWIYERADTYKYYGDSQCVRKILASILMKYTFHNQAGYVSNNLGYVIKKEAHN